MADIPLLFEVQGGSSFAEGSSGKLIRDQLTDIANKINEKPFGVKFEADTSSLKAIKDAFADLHESIGKNGVIKFDTPNLSDISKTLSGISENFKHVLTGIGNQNLQLKKIFEAIPAGSDDSVRSLQKVAGMIAELTDTITNLGVAVDEINQKSGQAGAVNLNLVNDGAIKKSEEQLNVYREYLQVLLREFEQAQAVYNKIMASNTGSGARAAFDASAVIESDKQLRATLTNFNYTAMSDSVSSMDLDQVKAYVNVYSSMLTTLSSIQSRSKRVFGDINTAGIEDARKKAEEATTSIQSIDDTPAGGQSGLFEHLEKVKEAIETLREPCNAVKTEIDKIFTFDNVDLSGENVLVQKVREMCEQLGAEFDGLREKIATTFNFSDINIIPPDVTETFEKIKSAAAAIPAGGVTGVTKSDLESLVRSGLGADGRDRTQNVLEMFGVVSEEAKRVSTDLETMAGHITSVTTETHKAEDGVVKGFTVIANAADDLGNAFQHRLTYGLKEVKNEAGETVKELSLVDTFSKQTAKYGTVQKSRSSTSSTAMNENQIKTSLNELAAKRAEIEALIRNAENVGLGDAEQVQNLRNLLPELDALREKLEGNSASVQEFSEAMKYTQSVVKESGRPITSAANATEDLAEKIERAANSVRGPWGEASAENAAHLERIKTSLSEAKEQYNQGTIDAVQYGTAVGKLGKEYDALDDAVRREYDTQKLQNTEAKKADRETVSRVEMQRRINKEIDNAIKLLRDYKAASKSKNESSRTAYADIQQQIKYLEDLNHQLEIGSITPQEAAESFAKYTNALAENRKEVRQNGDDHMTAFGKIGRAIKTHLTTLTATASIGTVMRYIRQMVEEVREIDKAMTELKKVTDETDARYTQFLENAGTRAKALSATISDTITATADFARLGFDIDLAEQAADAAIVYKSVGDDIETIDDAAQSIISTMKAFGIEATDSMTIVDKFNEVGNRFAISSGGIGEALKRSASAMQAANNTLDETIGLATAANTIIQNPASVGTTLKTVSMYIRAAKTELEQAGEETDGIAESTAELRDLIMQITRGAGKAVDIMADENTFKSTYQILKEISEVWDNIEDKEQAALQAKLGGKRNANAIAAILENFEIAEQAMETAANSAGSAMTELSKYQESIEGHIVRLKTAFQDLAKTLIDSDLVKKVVDFGTLLLDILTSVVKLIDKVGGLNTVLAVTGGLMAWSGRGKMLDTLLAMHEGFKKVTSSGTGFIGVFKSLTSSLSTGSVVFGAVTAAVTAAGIAYGIYKQKVQEARDAVADAASTANEHSGDLIELYREYEKLNKQVETDESAKDSLAKATDTLREALGLEEVQVNNLAQRYGNLTDAIKQATAESLKNDLRDLQLEYNEREKELLRNDNSAGISMNTSRIDVFGVLSNSEKAAIDALRSKGLITNTRYGALNPLEEGLEVSYDSKTIEGLKDGYEKLKAILDTLDSLGIRRGALYNAIKSEYTDLGKRIEGFDEISNQINDTLLNLAYVESTIGKGAVETSEDFDALRDSMIRTVGATGKFVDDMGSIEDAVDTFLKGDAAYAQFYENVSISASGAVDTIAERIDALTAKRDELADHTQALKDYIEAYEDFIALENEATGAGYTDIGETVFGNIDTNNRQLLEWTEDSLAQYRDVLASWGYTADEMQDMLGSISTVLGTSGNWDGLEIAFSPILQTENGPVLLSSETVDKYIFGLIDELSSNGGVWTDEDLIRLDTRGLEIDGVTVKNILAGVGEDARRVGEVMHYAGQDGALTDAFIQMRNAANKAGVPLANFRDRIDDITSEVADGEAEIDRYNKRLEELAERANRVVAPDLGEQITAYKTKISVLSNALTEYSESGKITVTTLRALNEAFGEDSKLISVVNGKLELNKDAINSLIDKMREEYAVQLALGGATEDQVTQLDAMAASLRSVAQAAEDPTSELEELTGLLKKMNEGVELSTFDTLKLIQKYPELRNKIIDTAKGYQIEESAIRDLISAKADLLTMTQREIGVESARTALEASSNSGTNQAKAIQQIFADYATKNGSNITSMKQFLNAYQEKFGHAFADSTDVAGGGGLGSFAGDYKAYTNYVKKLIEYYKSGKQDESVLQKIVDDIVSETGPKEGYTPEKETKTSSSTTTTKEETEFEKAYKKHQHDLAMDKETTEAYLSWLNWAYQDAYNKNEITLDDWYKYEEEVYEGRKQLFQTSIDEMQHQIDLLEHQNGDTYEEQAAIYMRMQKAVHAQADALRARGIKENDEMIRELQDQWWSYEEAIRQLRQESFDDWLNDQKFTIDLQKKNNESTDAILQSWKTVLGSLNDELEYYLSVGYDKTSDVVQSLMGEIDDAKDEMLAVLDEVVSKANEAVDGFQNVYTTLTNAAKEYASTGYLSVDNLQSILELGPKYLDMLYDESGQLVINEQRLQEVIAARTNELAAETALSYAKQILLATEAGETDKLRELADIQASASNATWDMAYATLGYAKALGAAKGIEESFYDNAISYVTKMQSVTQTATASISAYYETLNAGYVSQAEGLETILKLTEDMIKQENDDKIQALEDEKDIYKDIIDEKKELLRIAKEQADRDRDQADKLKEIADLQSRIDQLALDDSREAAAQRSQLEAELLEKQKALADEQGDYAYDAQVDALDKQYEAFEDTQDKEEKRLKEELNSAEKLYQAAIERIENGWDTLYRDLLDWNYNYGSTLQKDLIAAWDAAYAAAERYGSFVDAMEGVKEHTRLGEASYTPQSANVQSAVSRGSATITNYTNRMRANSLAWFTAENPSVYAQENQRLAKEYQQQTGTSLTYNNGSWYQSGSTTPLYQLSRDEVGHAVVEAMKANSAAWNNSDYNTQMKLAQTNEDLAKRLSSFLGVQITKTPGGVWMLGATPLYDVRKFHSGGIAGGNGTIKQNEIMAILKKGESVLDSKREEALYKTIDFVQILSDKIGRVIDKGGISSLLTGNSLSLMAPMGRAVAGGIGTMNFAPTVNVTISGGNLSDENARKYGSIAADTVLDQLKTAFTKRGISATGNGILK